MFSPEKQRISQFLAAESGAVTVDWTVLAAAIVGLGISTVAAVRTGVVSLGGDIDNSLSNASVVALGALGDGISVVGAYTRSFLSVSQADHDGWLADIAWYSAEDRASAYQLMVNTALGYIAEGNVGSAAYYVDLAATYADAISAAGETIPEGLNSVEELDGLYQELIA